MKNALVAAVVTALVLLCVFLTFSSRRGIAPKQSTVGPSLLDETTTHTPLVQESVTVQPPINQASPDPELLRLRGQVSVLRNALRTNEVQAQMFTPAEDFSDQGTLTPQASISSLFWAASTGERNRYKSMIVWGEEAIATAKAQQGASFDPNNVFFSPSLKEPALEGFQILAVEQTSPDAAEATLLKKFKNGKADMTRIPLVKVADEWKWYVANPADVTPIPFIQPAGN